MITYPPEMLPVPEDDDKVQVVVCNHGEICMGWQTIETAPKDGTDFLAVIPYKKKSHIMVGAFAPNGRFVSWPGRWNYEPTHWAPLPEPPKVTAPAHPTIER